MATGSYEGSLPMEGIPDHQDAPTFTRRRYGWSWRSPHPPTRSKPFKRRTDGDKQHSRKRVRREGERGSRQGCQRFDRTGIVGRKRPRSSRKAARLKGREACSKAVRRSGLGRRETSGPPVLPRGAEDSVGCPRSESCEREPGTHQVRVHAVRLGGRHRLDASRVFSTGRSQGLLVNQRGR
jgi:hypothetical protein